MYFTINSQLYKNGTINTFNPALNQRSKVPKHRYPWFKLPKVRNINVKNVNVIPPE